METDTADLRICAAAIRGENNGLNTTTSIYLDKAANEIDKLRRRHEVPVQVPQQTCRRCAGDGVHLRLRTPCPACGGSGVAPVPENIAKVFEAIKVVPIDDDWKLGTLLTANDLLRIAYAAVGAQQAPSLKSAPGGTGQTSKGHAMNTEHIDITKPVTSPQGDVTGIIDAMRCHPDGSTVVRINDHWFFASEIRQAE